MVQKQFESLQPQQIEGHVYFDDGTLLESWDPFYYMRAYHSADTTTQVGVADIIDPIGGHYGISGDNMFFPSGTYYVKTDFVTKDNILYFGRRWVNHKYNISTHSDVFLYPITFSQIDGIVSFENGKKPSGNPFINIYQYGELKTRTTIQAFGKYSFLDIPENWASGNYYVQTDIIYKDGYAYQGSIAVFHEQFVRTKDQNILLYRIDSRP